MDQQFFGDFRNRFMSEKKVSSAHRLSLDLNTSGKQDGPQLISREFLWIGNCPGNLHFPTERDRSPQVHHGRLFAPVENHSVTGPFRRRGALIHPANPGNFGPDFHERGGIPFSFAGLKNREKAIVLQI